MAWYIIRSDKQQDDELMHYGIKGQRWGERNYQYEDGSLTPEGKLRYGDNSASIAATKLVVARKKRTGNAHGLRSRERSYPDVLTKGKTVRKGEAVGGGASSDIDSRPTDEHESNYINLTNEEYENFKRSQENNDTIEVYDVDLKSSLYIPKDEMFDYVKKQLANHINPMKAYLVYNSRYGEASPEEIEDIKKENALIRYWNEAVKECIEEIRNEEQAGKILAKKKKENIET